MVMIGEPVEPSGAGTTLAPGNVKDLGGEPSGVLRWLGPFDMGGISLESFIVTLSDFFAGVCRGVLGSELY